MLQYPLLCMPGPSQQPCHVCFPSVQVYAPRKGLYDQMTHATGDWDSWSPDNGDLMLTQGEQVSCWLTAVGCWLSGQRQGSCC